MTRTIFSFIFLLACVPVLAQDSSFHTSLDEVVITANKYPTKTSRTGKVISVITREQLQLAGGKDLSQMLNEQVGIYINGANSNPGKDKTVFLRGAKIDYTLITIDGIPVYDASGIGGNFDIRMIPIDNIERVEILKGSQSTLYGSDAIAGVINIITKKPAGKNVNATGMISAGSYGTIRASTNFSLNRKKFDYQLGLSTFNTNGINETIDTSANGKNEKDGYNQHTVDASFGWKPSEGMVFRPFIRYTKSIAEVDNGSFIDELDNKATQENLQAGMRNQWNIGNTTMHLLYNFNFTDRLYLDDSTLSHNGYYFFSRDAYKSKEHYAEFYFHTPINQRLRLSSGIDLRRSSTSQEHWAKDNWGTYASSIGADSVHQRQTGIYAALNGQLGKGFNIEAGGRWNNHSSYGNNFVYSINPSLLIKERYKLFLNVSTAYKTPGLYQLFSEYGNKDLQPEKAFTIEGGMEYFGKDEKFHGRLVYFNRKMNDVLFFYYDAQTFRSRYINQDRQEDHGLEAEATIRFSKALEWRMNYSYVTGNVTSIDAGKDTSYFNLLRRPKHSWGTTLGWKVNKKLYVSANVQGYGTRQDMAYDPSTYSSKAVELDAYLLAGCYADLSLAAEKLHLFADIRNLFNTKYQEVYGYNNPGINGYLGIRFRLGGTRKS